MGSSKPSLPRTRPPRSSPHSPRTQQATETKSKANYDLPEFQPGSALKTYRPDPQTAPRPAALRHSSAEAAKQKQFLLRSQPAGFSKRAPDQAPGHPSDPSVELLQDLVETLKKKAASRKNSLKLMYDILSGKEKENEKLRLMVEESKHILIAFCEEASRLYSEKSEEIAFKVQDSLEKLESLHRKVKRAPSQERPVQRSQPKSKTGSEKEQAKLDKIKQMLAAPNVNLGE